MPFALDSSPRHVPGSTRAGSWGRRGTTARSPPLRCAGGILLGPSRAGTGWTPWSVPSAWGTPRTRTRRTSRLVGGAQSSPQRRRGSQPVGHDSERGAISPPPTLPKKMGHLFKMCSERDKLVQISTVCGFGAAVPRVKVGHDDLKRLRTSGPVWHDGRSGNKKDLNLSAALFHICRRWESRTKTNSR